MNKKTSTMKDGSSAKERFEVFVNSTSNLFSLFIKNYLKSSAFFINNILVPLIITFGVILFLPICEGFIWIISLTLLFTSFVTYGVLYFNFRNSNAYKNLELTNVTTASIYVSIFLILLMATFLTLFVDFLFVEVSILGNIISDMSNSSKAADTTFKYNILETQWSLLVYYWINMSILTFSISMVIQEISQSQKVFFLVVFVFILSSLTFAGSFSPTIYVDSNGNFEIMDMKKLNELSSSEQFGYVRPYVWGGKGWYLSQIFPTYGINQITFGVFNSAVTTYVDGIAQSNQWQNKNVFDLIFYSHNHRIIYYIVSPWIWTFFSFWLGGSLNTRKLIYK